MKRIIPRADDPFKKFLLFSLGLHLLVIGALNIKWAFSNDDQLLFQSAIRVDVVALPEKATAKKPVVAPIKTPKKKRPEKPKPKKTVKKKNKTKKKVVSLKKNKNKQLNAIERLKAMEAIEKLKNETPKEPAAPPQEFKGNRLSSGSQLEGLNRLQFESYYDKLKTHLYNNWSIPQWLADKRLKAQALAVIDRNGNITNKSILTSSGNDVFDSTVLKAIEQASPFPAAPDRLKSLISGKEIVFGFPGN